MARIALINPAKVSDASVSDWAQLEDEVRSADSEGSGNYIANRSPS